MDNVGIALAVLATSTLSGILGMGGGMILMGIFLLLLPLEWAMVLHGCTQLASNGSRAWLHRTEVEWRFLPRYFAGAVVVDAVVAHFAAHGADAGALLVVTVDPPVTIIVKAIQAISLVLSLYGLTGFRIVFFLVGFGVKEVQATHPQSQPQNNTHFYPLYLTVS